MRYLSTLYLSSLTLTAANPLGEIHSRADTIQWEECKVNDAGIPVECATLPVPLDYTDKNSKQTLKLELLRTKAVKEPVKGSIIFNFGGPGATGKEDFAYYGPRLLAITGGHHNLVTFVPRGTSEALPFSCYPSIVERTIGQLSFPPLSGNSSDTALGRNWASTTLIADSCAAHSGKNGTLVGTASVARDIMQIVDKLGEDGGLRYWGISYGTLLGSTLIAMFPSKVESVVLDAVVNPHQYYHGYETELYTDADKAFQGFCKGCADNPSLCALSHNRSAAEIESAVYAILSTLKYHPLPISLPGASLLLDYTLIKSVLIRALYTPATWPTYARILDALETGNISAVAAFLNNTVSGPAPISTEAQFGIKCGDSFTRAKGIEDVVEPLKQRHSLSKIGGDTADSVLMQCAQWQMEANERYEGDFHVKTRKPVLVIGNTYDPVTPLIAAKNVSAGFEGSILLQQNGIGHSILTQGSICSARIIAAYFVNGTMPKEGTVCEVDAKMFSGDDGWEDVVKQIVGGW